MIMDTEAYAMIARYIRKNKELTQLAGQDSGGKK